MRRVDSKPAWRWMRNNFITLPSPCAAVPSLRAVAPALELWSLPIAPPLAGARGCLPATRPTLVAELVVGLEIVEPSH